ncbi:NTP transferase domain-containing protein [Nocardia sp. alder85J]|uniref:NTP transferase domain-containing protein n=1 Tax=Nocardia sp. alder85J TaxID=2862949 RepID=UPI001CD52E0C|nr:NTP transferase domain-containing protein [Nocardia sp. alder85J]MCX4097764.1 NTP transferase domain-containing protein [Nocardia sp. alder85J]
MATVVVLAGGAGSRFAAPYPKELHALRPGVSVIDPLMHAIGALAEPVRVVVVVSAAKLGLVGHLARYRRHDTAFVLADNPAAAGMASGLAAAYPWCDDQVLVCLGDQVYLGDPVPAFTTALATVGDGASIAVIAAACTDPDRLRRDGALTVTDGIVTAAAEKPRDPAGFTACWSAVAVGKPMLPRLAADLATPAPACLMNAAVVWGPAFGNLNEPADARGFATGEVWP